MKPNPLSALNHLTVPVAMLVLRVCGAADAEEAIATTAGAGTELSPSRLLEPSPTIPTTRALVALAQANSVTAYTCRPTRTTSPPPPFVNTAKTCSHLIRMETP